MKVQLYAVLFEKPPCTLLYAHKQLTLISDFQASRVLSSSSGQGGPH